MLSGFVKKGLDTAKILKNMEQKIAEGAPG